ncbi:MAG: S46 family peptidase [Prevotella sp.]|nr:S46 family peptidase [Prevotella sp.]
MKRITLIFALAPLFVLTSHADEGMWTLMDLPQAVYERMAEEGYDMSYGSLYNDSDAIYKAVVNFGDYCTGVVVSADGLLFTNHHCGFESIRANSTVEHDYMLNGFCAQSYADELPNEDLFVSFMIAQKDVTPLVEEYDFRSLDFDKQEEVLSIIEDMEDKRIKAICPNLRAEMLPYYEGNRYYVDIYEDFRDVRLVFAVPKSMGKFGGETDNWMWPRQTCDFSVFRIYADPETNGPSEYKATNVPYRPKVWAHVSLQGYKEGDYAMTIGYPGGTERYLSSFGIKEMRDAENTPRWQTREVKQDVMLRHMRQDEAVRIKYDSKYANSANYWKNAIGMNKCIDSLGIVSLKENYEAAIRAYVDSTGYLKGELDFALLDSLYQKRAVAARGMTLFYETFSTDELSKRARKYTRGGMEVRGDESNKKKQYVMFDDNSDTYDIPTDKEILTALLKNYAEKADTAYLPAFFETINTTYGGDYDRYASDVYSKSILLKNGAKIRDDKKTTADIGVVYGLDLTETYGKILEDYRAESNLIDEQERYLCAAKMRMEQDMPHYSDANFTLRMSYGQVGGYDQYGTPSGYYTTPQSLVAKMKQADDNYEYFAEPVMHELFSADDFGKYADATTGTLNLCFLTNNDITGGNSGSPVFDAHNRLIGLAFDGNWESLSADIFFEDRLARCICVDIRYVLYMIDKWGKAERLINEIAAE